MNITAEKNNIIITGLRDFSLRDIFECGQCFRWDMTGDGSYTGVAYSRALSVSQLGDTLIMFDTDRADFDGIWRSYFDLDCDYGKIKARLCEDPVMRTACAAGGGIRILRQELWETVVSFIISASNNIPRIKLIISRLCREFGDRISYRGGYYYAFPPPERIARLGDGELKVIRAGFRDKYIAAAARAFSSGEIDSDRLLKADEAKAKAELMKLYGVGNKVADCIMLFGLHKTGAFPVDVWIKRIMEHCYFDSPQSKDAISRFAAERFGALGGYAQQYLFYWARENFKGGI